VTGGEDGAAEVPLHGGTANRGLVVRVGDTVHRPLRPTAAATHALLRHLERVGFPAPRFLGVDRTGREVLSYVPGSAVVPPYPGWALTDEALASVAVLLRAYHRAVRTFDAAGHRWPPSPPARYAGPLVSHNDPNLDNVVFRGGRAAALIDFDLASPGSPIWDVACAARLWVPLRAEADIDDVRRGRVAERLRAFVDAYGVPATERGALLDAVEHNHRWFQSLIRRHAAQGHGAFAEYWTPETAARSERGMRWYRENRSRLRAALGD
jgi:hypothetical protein